MLAVGSSLTIVILILAHAGRHNRVDHVTESDQLETNRSESCVLGSEALDALAQIGEGLHQVGHVPRA